MSLRHLPNLLCVLRILMVYPVAHSILTGRYPAVMALFAVAAFTDALDGFLAKRFDWTSELGKVLDPLADKLLLLTVFICLSIVGIAPWWLTALVLLRATTAPCSASSPSRRMSCAVGSPRLAPAREASCTAQG